jgi:hypothetical protein
MSTTKPTIKKAIWPVIAFYFLFIAFGILGLIVSPVNVVINSIDFIIYGCYYFVVPISVAISLLFLQVIHPHPEFTKQHIVIKIILHVFSILLISWGIFGGLNFVNKLPSKSQPYVMKGEIISLYKKEPSNNNVKRTYHKTRYFVTLLETATEKEYNLQISETLYDSIDIKQNTPIIIEDKENYNVEIKNNTQTTINLKKGWINIIY